MTSTVNANFSDVASRVQPPQGMSIADMLNIAKNAQAYQQAQQINPLQTQKAQLELQQLQQTNPLALREQAAKTTLAEKTLEPGISKAESEAARASTQLNSEKVENIRKQIANSSRNLLNILTTKEELTPELLKQKTLESLKNSNASPEAVTQALQLLPQKGSDKELRAFVASHATNSLNAEAQLEKLFPAVSLQNIGGKLVPVTTGNPTLAQQAPGQQVNAGIKTTIQPQVYRDPITGQATIIGNQGESTQPTPSTPSGVSQGGPLPPSMALPSGQVGMGAPSQKNTQLQQLPNESPENFNARLKDTQTSYTKALDQYNNPNSEYGHIPSIQNINKNILDYLKDPQVNTGAVAKYMADKTLKGTLNPKEQELAKFLEQRIQRLTPRSDADSQSKREAFGSFNLGKDALIDLVRNDNINLTTQDLQAKGILHNGGSQINPNYGNVAAFNQKFANYSKNNDLMRYISLVGEGQKAKLDKNDIEAFNKFIGKMSIDERKALEQQRQEVLNLVKGQ